MKKYLLIFFCLLSVNSFADWSFINHQIRVTDILGRSLVDYTLKFDEDTIRIPIVISIYNKPEEILNVINAYYSWYKRDPIEFKQYALSRYEEEPKSNLKKKKKKKSNKQ